MKIKRPDYIESVSNFVDFIERFRETNEQNGKNDELLFRGQGIDRPLIPKIGRLNLRIKNNGIVKTEKLILEEFRRGILPLTEFKPENDWDLLALAQHHGLPTRLLDWSFSALVALWFSVDKPPQKDVNGMTENGVLWILNADTDDFRIDTTETNPFDNSITKIFRPAVISRRISAQAGVFTVHKILGDNKMIRLENNKNYKSKLTKFLIRGNDFAKIRKQLSMLGIGYSTIFPDMDGLCKNLEWRFAKHTDE